MAVDREGITPEWLRENISYCCKTGVMLWKPRHSDKRWTTRYAGKPALANEKKGYLSGCIAGHFVLAHRAAWAMHFNAWPSGEIDHINGDRTDNRIKNLRNVSPRENNRNRATPRTNTSGIMGVARDPENKSKWRASICDRGCTRIIGRFYCLGLAIKARKQREKELGFHENHGRTSL